MKVIWRAEGGPAALSSRASLLLMHSLSLSLSSSSSLSLTFLSSLPFIFFSPHFCLSTHTPRTDWTFWWCLCVRHGSNEGNQCVWPITCDDRDHIIRLKAGRGGGWRSVAAPVLIDPFHLALLTLAWHCRPISVQSGPGHVAAAETSC